MNTSAVLPLHAASAAPRERAPLSPLARTAFTAMVVMAALLAGVQILMFGFHPPLTVFASLFLTLAAFTLLGWRWAPAGGAVAAALQLLLQIPYLLQLITRLPAREFAPLSMLVACSVVTLVTGVGAAVQGYRRPAWDRRAPRWLAPGVAALIGCCAGAVALGMAPRAATGLSLDRETLRALPSLSAHRMAFGAMEIRAHVGETVALRLENHDTGVHLFEIDELGVHTVMPPNGTAIAVFRPLRAGTYRFYCGPHFDRASGRGMHGTLVVAPADADASPALRTIIPTADRSTPVVPSMHVSSAAQAGG